MLWHAPSLRRRAPKSPLPSFAPGLSTCNLSFRPSHCSGYAGAAAALLAGQGSAVALDTGTCGSNGAVAREPLTPSATVLIAVFRLTLITGADGMFCITTY